MTIVSLLEELKNFIEAQIKEYDYKLVGVNGGSNRAMVCIANMPLEMTDVAFIIIKLVKVHDAWDKATAEVRLVFTVHDANAADNWRGQLNLIEHVRQALFKQRTIANRFRLDLPVSYELTEYSQAPQPEGYGFLNLTYQIGQVQEEDFGDDRYGK